jgi:Flp pilus assembly protein TadB
MTMHPALLTSAFGLLAALIVAPIVRRLCPTSRGKVAQSATLRSHKSLPDYAALLDAIARRVRSGSSLTSAVVDEIDLATPLGEVVDRLGEGGSLVAALAGVTRGHADLSLTVQALSATAHLGGPVAATLDEAAAVLRERAAARAERHAHGSQARLSARVLTVVPLVFAAWSAAASERTRDIYLSSVAGTICALFGLALNVAGWQWMKRTIGAR